LWVADSDMEHHLGKVGVAAGGDGGTPSPPGRVRW
jgi:hypothetical protein